SGHRAGPEDDRGGGRGVERRRRPLPTRLGHERRRELLHGLERHGVTPRGGRLEDERRRELIDRLEGDRVPLPRPALPLPAVAAPPGGRVAGRRGEGDHRDDNGGDRSRSRPSHHGTLSLSGSWSEPFTGGPRTRPGDTPGDRRDMTSLSDKPRA